MTRRPFIALLAGAAMTAAAWGGYSGYHYAVASPTEGAVAAAPAPSVIAEFPTVQSITEWDSYAGRFVAVDRVDIRSRVSGYLDAVHFTDGDIVQQGDLLFTIDPRPFEAEVAVAEAEVAEAEATLALARADLRRSTELYKTRTVSKQRVDQDRARTKSAEAQVKAAQSRLNVAKLDLGFTEVRAPITGRIDAHNIDVGNLVRGDAENGQALTNIVALDPIHIVFDIDQNAYLNYQRAAAAGQGPDHGTEVTPVQLALPGETGFQHEAALDFVSNSIDQATGTIRARAVIDNPDFSFTPGLFARVQLLNRADAEALLIPDEAIGLEQSDRVVFVVGANNKVESRKVALGPIVDGKRVVRHGVSAEDRIITRGLHRVYAGMEVSAEMGIAAAPKTNPADQFVSAK